MKTLDENYAEVTFNPFWHAVVVKWKDVSTLSDCQQALDAILETVMCFNCKNIVSDFSYSKSYSGILTDWMKVEFMPRLANQGIRKFAFLIEHSSPHKFFVEKLQKDVNMMGNLFKIFYSRRELEGWIKDYELIRKPVSSVSPSDAAQLGYFY